MHRPPASLRNSFRLVPGGFFLAAIFAIAVPFSLLCAVPVLVSGSGAVPADIMTLVPAEDRHVFAAPDPAWFEMTWFVPPRGALVEAKSDAPPGTPLKKLEQFYDDKAAYTADINSYRKQITYDTEGKRVSEVDVSKDRNSRWRREYFPDGTIKAYYCTDGTNIAVVGVRPDHLMASVRVGATGELLTWEASGNITREWVLPTARTSLRMVYTDGTCTAVEIISDPVVIFSAKPGQEQFTSLVRQESWKIQPGHAEADFVGTMDLVDGKYTTDPRPPPDEIARGIVGPYLAGNRGPSPTRETERSDYALKYYPVRREEVMVAMDEVLRKAGKTWADFGLTALRAAPLAKLPNADPQWLVPKAAQPGAADAAPSTAVTVPSSSPKP